MIHSPKHKQYNIVLSLQANVPTLAKELSQEHLRSRVLSRHFTEAVHVGSCSQIRRLSDLHSCILAGRCGSRMGACPSEVAEGLGRVLILIRQGMFDIFYKGLVPFFGEPAGLSFGGHP